MRGRHQRLDAVAAADFQGHHGTEFLAGIFLLHLDGAGDVAAVGEAFLANQRRPHVGHHRDPVVVGEIQRRDQFDAVPLGIEPPHVEEPEIRAAAAAGAEDPGADREAFDVVEGDRGCHAGPLSLRGAQRRSNLVEAAQSARDCVAALALPRQFARRTDTPAVCVQPQTDQQLWVGVLPSSATFHRGDLGVVQT